MAYFRAPLLRILHCNKRTKLNKHMKRQYSHKRTCLVIKIILKKVYKLCFQKSTLSPIPTITFSAIFDQFEVLNWRLRHTSFVVKAQTCWQQGKSDVVKWMGVCVKWSLDEMWCCTCWMFVKILARRDNFPPKWICFVGSKTQRACKRFFTLVRFSFLCRVSCLGQGEPTSSGKLLAFSTRRRSRHGSRGP